MTQGACLSNPSRSTPLMRAPAAMLAWTHLEAYLEPFDGVYPGPAALDRALEWRRLAVDLDPSCHRPALS